MVAGGADEAAGRFLRHLAAPPCPPPHPPPLCHQTSSRKKPAARTDTRLGSKVEALACLSQRSSACQFQSSSFGFKLPPRRRPPPAAFMFLPLRFFPRRRRKSSRTDGQRYLSTSYSRPSIFIQSAKAQLIKTVGDLPASDAVTLGCLPTSRFTATRRR